MLTTFVMTLKKCFLETLCAFEKWPSFICFVLKLAVNCDPYLEFHQCPLTPQYLNPACVSAHKSFTSHHSLTSSCSVLCMSSSQHKWAASTIGLGKKDFFSTTYCPAGHFTCPRLIRRSFLLSPNNPLKTEWKQYTLCVIYISWSILRNHSPHNYWHYFVMLECNWLR